MDAPFAPSTPSPPSTPTSPNTPYTPYTPYTLGPREEIEPQKRRLILLCDGTWMNGDRGLNGDGKPQIPSNVTRLGRALKHGVPHQIISYQHGVGTGSTLSEVIGGGAFGLGISDNIRAAYAFICANYVPGDEIILVGFSRGAFTARSVARMIADLGLLTSKGMEIFSVIFKDMQNWENENYEDQNASIPFPNKPWVWKEKDKDPRKVADKYREELRLRGFTRAFQSDDQENPGPAPAITVKAVAVWDTVGSLGIPRNPLSPVATKLGFRHAAVEYQFFDTILSDRVENAFQALALDETRGPFSPAIWELTKDNKITNLKQVWFPGNHANVGGGWADSGIANISLAWMMDQLEEFVEFEDGAIDTLFRRLKDYYEMEGKEGEEGEEDTVALTKEEKCDKVIAQWMALARDKINSPGFISKVKSTLVRPLCWFSKTVDKKTQLVKMRYWALGALLSNQYGFSGMGYRLLGYKKRTPGMYVKVDPKTAEPAEPKPGESQELLENTNERIHSSVRVRLALGGAGLNDVGLWDASVLAQWKLDKTPPKKGAAYSNQVDTAKSQTGEDPSGVDDVPPADMVHGGSAGEPNPLPIKENKKEQPPQKGTPGEKFLWYWNYSGDNEKPHLETLPEEPLGRWEKKLLYLSFWKPEVEDEVTKIDLFEVAVKKETEKLGTSSSKLDSKPKGWWPWYSR